MDAETPIVIVSAMSKATRALGKNNQLLWHIPADLKHFKTLTLGHPVIMGRKTFESIIAILGTPLPNRTNIVVTRDKTYTHPDAKIAHSLEAAIRIAQSEHPTEIHIGGGAELYRQALPLTSRLHITWVFDEPEADSFFPEFMNDFTVVTEHPIQTHHGLQYQWVDYVRKRS